MPLYAFPTKNQKVLGVWAVFSDVFRVLRLFETSRVSRVLRVLLRVFI